MLQEVIGFCLLGSIIFLSIVFAIAQRHARFDLIDVAWGLVFMLIALISYTTHAPGITSAQSLVTALVIIWGMRLAIHIYQRWNKSDKEDKRYAAFRQQYAKKSGGLGINIYVRVFLVQAVLAVIISLPVILINAAQQRDFNGLVNVGLLVWIIGFYFEALGDYQLKKHVANPKNKGVLMTSGLWRYTRHPNYFGEFTQWWGIFIMVLPDPLWWVALIGPAVVSLLLLFVSGVPLTEKHFEGRKGWKEYKQRTSVFLPLPPKKG